MDEPLIDPSLDLEVEIQRLRKERNAVILAHYYQSGRSRTPLIPRRLPAALPGGPRYRRRRHRVCGVHFMAETAKILNPEKVVVLLDLNAGCSLSDSCPADALARFKELDPDHAVVSYINCSAGVKALSDMICTSSNAERVIASFPEDPIPCTRPEPWACQKNSGRRCSSGGHLRGP